MKHIITVFLLLSFWQLQAQQVAKNEYGTFHLTNATIHTVTNGTITGDVLIKEGKIAGVGTVTTTENVQQIDCTGKHIYPGFIDGGTRLGLSEVGSVSLTQDYNEVGDATPQMQALTAVNPNSVAIPVTRVNGVTTALVVPSGGIFSGTAALINLHGYTPKDMFAEFKGIRMNFPSSGRRGRRDRRSDEDLKKEHEKAQKRLNDIWSAAVLHAKIDSANTAAGQTTAYNPEMEALAKVVTGEIPLLVEVNKKDDILLALKWIKKNQVNAILTGVSDGWRVVDSIKSQDLSVITGPVLSVPSRDSDKYDAPYTNAAKMVAAGIKVAIRTNETENVRNLPFNAGFAATYGLGVEEALKAITITPAEIFGVADKYGSIEEGKIANLFVSDGDPFEMKTRITDLFIKGWKIPIESRHTLLYDEFIERSPGLTDK